MGTKRRVWMILGAVAFVVTFKLMLWLFAPAQDTGYYDTAGSLGELHPPDIVLITRGIEPREPLRLRPEAGVVRRFRLTSADTMRASAVTETLSDTELESALTVRGRIDRVHDDGSFDWSWKVTGAEVLSSSSTGKLANPEGRRLMEGLKGLKGTSVVDDRGFVLRSSLDGGGRDSNMDLRQAVARALCEPTVHLPDEPIGERAIWEVHRREVRQGIEMEAVERYELMQRRGHDLVLTMRLTATAGHQEIDAFFGDVLRTELTSYESEGGGEWTFSLGGDLSATGQGWRDEDVRMEQSFQGLPIQVGMASRSEVSLDSVR